MLLTGHHRAAQNCTVERRSFFSRLIGEIGEIGEIGQVVPRAVNARMGSRAKERRSGFERLHLSAQQALAVQAIYEQHADRDEGARRELRNLTEEQRRLFLALDDQGLPAIRERMSVQRTILHEVASNRTLAICRILDETQRRLFVDMRPARLSS